MRYGIMINLDYENHPYNRVREVFEAMRQAMLAHGFRQDGRVFTIELLKREACDLARRVVEEIEADHRYPDSAYNYIKDFYGFDFERAENLLLPPSGEIDVEELNSVDDVEIVQFCR